MNPNDLEELRYDVAHELLSRMSKGSQFQHALDRMLTLMSLYTEEELLSIRKQETKDKSKKNKGF